MEYEIRKRSYYFSLEVVKFINLFDGRRINFSLTDQLLRSATSVGANLVEATAAHSKRDFIKYYEIGLKSANESKYWLCLFRDGLDVDKDKVKELLQEAVEISKIVATIVVKLKKTKGPVPQVKEEVEDYLPF
ncbi:MAG: four helix bundle protein [Bacteroidetes bacterium]|nr:four helix bundle protein [Bacteroidota bacterium]